MFSTAYLLKKNALSEVNKHTGTLNTQLNTQLTTCVLGFPPCPRAAAMSGCSKGGWMRSRDGWAGLALPPPPPHWLLRYQPPPTPCPHSILGKQAAAVLSQPCLSPELVFPRWVSYGLSGQSSLRIAFLSAPVPADPSDCWPVCAAAAAQHCSRAALPWARWFQLLPQFLRAWLSPASLSL